VRALAGSTQFEQALHQAIRRRVCSSSRSRGSSLPTYLYGSGWLPETRRKHACCSVSASWQGLPASSRYGKLQGQFKGPN